MISGMLEHVAGVGPSGVGGDAGQDDDRLLDEGDVENAAFDVDAVQDLFSQSIYFVNARVFYICGGPGGTYIDRTNVGKWDKRYK